MESTECLSDHRNGQLREGIKSRVLTATCICKHEQISRQHHHHMRLFFLWFRGELAVPQVWKKCQRWNHKSLRPRNLHGDLWPLVKFPAHVNDSFSCYDHFAPSIVLPLVFSFYSMETWFCWLASCGAKKELGTGGSNLLLIPFF